MQEQDLTRQLAHLIVYQAVDEDARVHARQGIIDFFAVTYPVIKELIPDSSWHAIRQVYADNTLSNLALKLGYAGHALDFDDFHADFRGHPSVVILPVLFALLDEQAYTFDHFLDAYCIGVEVSGRLGLAISQQHYLKGFHSTATLGIVASTAAMARFCRFDEDQVCNAIGLACTLSSGLRSQFGSAIKPLHVGFTCQRVIEIYRLVQSEVCGQSKGVLDNFLKAYSDLDRIVPEHLIRHWGNPFRIVSPSLEFKPYASCSGTHTTIDVVKKLKHEWLNTGQSIDDLLSIIDKIEL
ncbi:MAG: MmgE/PrpD family protein, partial [Acinetobacter sp.]